MRSIWGVKASRGILWYTNDSIVIMRKEITMRVLDAWGKTQDFFERKNIEMFFLVTLKAVKTTYVALFKYLLVPVLFIIGFDSMLSDNTGIVVQSGLFIAHIAVIIFLFLAVRPSTQHKIWLYYKGYVLHALIGGALLAIFFSIPIIWHGGIVAHIVYIELFVILAFALFFFFDTSITYSHCMQAPWRAIKMFVYNMPVCLVVSLVTVLGMVAASYAIVWIVKLWGIHMNIYGILMLIAPVLLSALSNLYIKFLHEQSDVYFAQPK